MSPFSFDPKHYATELALKQARLERLLTPFQPPAVEVFDSPPSHFRLRCEFRLWCQNKQLHYAMFSQGKPVLLEQFPVASAHVNVLMAKLQRAWQDNAVIATKLFQAGFLSTLSGDALVTLVYHRRLDEAWQAEASLLATQLGCSLIGRSRGQRIVIGRDHVSEILTVGGRHFSYHLPEACFSQPNGIVNQKMLNWASEALGQRDDDLLELYCGSGNFTLPLSLRVRRVLATEVNKTAVEAATMNLAANNITNVILARLSAEEITQALQRVRPFRRLAAVDLDDYRFTTLFVDPPRAGLDNATCEFARGFERILYISCNPETLAANIARLHDSHRIARHALFDQFPWSHHLESGVLLQRRKGANT